MLGCFSKTELTELGKLGKTTQFYSVLLSELGQLRKTDQFYSVLLGFTWSTWYRAMLVAWFYSEKPIGTKFAELGQLSTEWCLWVSVKHYCG